ncbi:MAG TPA: tetraacyldisaccharide 4'-kinase [Casimicrobiaceae bacterium]|nr:tetraacyldisaccharide 4'-kinase [Casimicrobiaceae bacterium]
MTFRHRLAAAWYAREVTALAALLSPLSLVFGLVAKGRRRFTARERIGRPVVVVGNISVGGAGKTPLVIALADALRSHRRKPGIVSRGYGGSEHGVRVVTSNDDWRIVGDEALLIAAAGHPVVVGRDRVAAARELLRTHPACDVVLSDDGLQHYRLHRDVEIAVIDARRGLGNGLLLPAGPLREPARRLDEVDAIVRLVDEPTPRRMGPRDFTMTHTPVGWRNLIDASRPATPTDWPRGTVHAVAAIGNPQRFFDLVRRMGIDAIPHPFPDHHPFVASDLLFEGAQAILMTAKDAVKCMPFADARFHALDIRANVDDALVDHVLARIDGRQAA